MIASGIRVNQSFQRLDQLGVMLDQRLPSSSRVPYSLNGERWLSKALDSPIDGRMEMCRLRLTHPGAI